MELNTYQPRKEQAIILDAAMAHIQSVPYRVSARWLFYRLLQDSLYHHKDDYHGKFLPLTAKARKRFYDAWHPSTLADDTRQVILGGAGFANPNEWLNAVIEQVTFLKDKWPNQDNYVELWFEAAAMVGQFQYYTEEIPLLAFHGDISIPEKWITAKRLEACAHQYDLPVIIIYFGDDDPKGWDIPKAALADIRAWCDIDFEFVRGGLNPGDAERFGIPANPDKPGTYQWEALADNQAGTLITDMVSRYYSKEALADIEADQDKITDKFQERFRTFIEHWND